jgi:hypothetical protein
MSMRQLYFATNGRFNDAVAFLQRLGPFSDPGLGREGVLREDSPDAANRIANDIRREGYHVARQRLSDTQTAEIRAFALTAPCVPRGVADATPMGFDPEHPVSDVYDFERHTIMESPAIRSLLTDGSLLTVARAYLGRCAVIYGVAMWWSTAGGRLILSEAAQMFHTDLDTVSWLNVFFYLTDVGPENGPHVFVAQSHRGKPRPIQRDGRIPDEEVHQWYAAEQIVQTVGPAGTIILEDTKGLHKGKALDEGARLMLQITYATTAFGRSYPKVPLSDTFGPEFLQRVRRNPRIFSGIFDL